MVKMTKEQFKKYRLKLGMTQTELGVTHFGDKSYATVSEIECGRRKISKLRAEKLLALVKQIKK